MTWIEAIILGIIQGLTEFLPVSSSGHLVIGQKLLGLKDLDKFICFDLVCHLGTLLAIFIVFWKKIISIIQKEHRTILLILLGTLPLFPLALFSEPIKGIFDHTEYLGYFFLITALMLYLATYYGWRKNNLPLSEQSYKDAFIIGFFQAFAILPGISRSGSTISSARLLGWTPDEAVTFSFLLSIPAILGGSILEFLKTFSSSYVPSELTTSVYIAGFLASFIVGILSLLWLIRLAQRNQFLYFVWYLLFLGIGALIYFN